MTPRSFRSCLLIALLAITSATAFAGTLNYQYDALGRLEEVQHPDGSVVSYTLDPAGNRTEVASRTPPGVPASITVPASSTTGNYTISWGAASGTLTQYELFEATNAGFSGEVLVSSGTALSQAISGKGNGSYYYRVRACNGSACGGFRTGGNATVVTLPPGVPASITVPASSTTGAYTISWGTSTGNVTAYQLYEATNSGFTGQVQVYSGTATSRAISGKGNGSYYYRVRACNGSQCSGYRTGANPTVVTLPPGVPASITVPASSSTGSYTVSWGTSTGTVTAYQLYEATNSGFTGQVQVYSGTGTSKAISGKTNGSYYYRVWACNGSACSGYRTGANATVVNIPVPAAPASITGPSMNLTGNYSISWASSTGATRYELWESINNGAFSKVHDGTATSKSFTNKPNGEYQYKAKACNATGCSGYSPTKLVQVCVGGCSFAAPPPEE
jgi:YD repeat-containing protein